MGADTVLTATLRDEISRGVAAIKEQLGGLDGVAKTAFGFASGTAIYDGVTAIAGGVRDLAGSTIGAAGDFEAGMNRFQSVTGDAVENANLSLQQFEQKFLDLGAQTQFSAAQAQEAAIALVKGGVSVADVMEGATSATLDLAAAGELDLAESADIVAKQLGAWGEQAGGAANVANQLAQAANASTVDVDELALGLANVSGTAKTAGVDFNELVQTMGMIAPNFASAADAGTSLKTFLSNLQPTTDPALEAMQELGLVSMDYIAVAKDLGAVSEDYAGSQADAQSAAVRMLQAQTGLTAGTKEFEEAWAEVTAGFETNAFYDAEGQFLGMENAAAKLQEATEGLSEAEKVMALNTIFGSDAIRAAAAIAGGGAEGFNSMGDAMVAAGDAGAQAAAKQKGFNFAMDSLMGSVETLQIMIGQALIPAGTDLINNVINPGVGAVMSFVGALQQGKAPIDALAATLGVSAGTIQTVITVVTSLGAALGTLAILGTVAGWVGGLTAAFAAAGGGIAGVAAVLGPLGPLLLTLTGPIGLVVAAVGLLTAAWMTNFGDIQGKTAAAWAFLQPIFTTLGEWLGNRLVAAGGELAGFWSGTLQPAFAAVGNFLNSTLFPILGALGSVWLALVKKELELASALIRNVIIPALQTFQQWIAEKVAPALATFAQAVGVQLQPKLKGLQDMLTGLKTWLGYISDAVGRVIDWFKRLADAIDRIEIPGWLQGASPPPLAHWIDFIAESTNRATASLGAMGRKLKDQDLKRLADGLKAIRESLTDEALGGAVSMAQQELQALRDIADLRDRGGNKENRENVAEVQAELARLRSEKQTAETMERQQELQARLLELQREATMLRDNSLTADLAEKNIADLRESLRELEATSPEAAAKIFAQQREAILEQARLQVEMRAALASGDYDTARDIQRQIDASINLASKERARLEHDLTQAEKERGEIIQQLMEAIPEGARATDELLEAIQFFDGIFVNGIQQLGRQIELLTDGLTLPTAPAPGFGGMSTTNAMRDSNSSSAAGGVVLQVNLVNPAPGLNQEQVKEWARQGAQEVVTRYDQQVSRQAERNRR